MSLNISNVHSTPQHGFIGQCTFEQAKKHCNEKYCDKKQKAEELTQHFDKHIQHHREHHHHPLNSDTRNRVKELYGNKASNKVYSAGNLYLDLEKTKGILQRQNQGKKTQESKDPVVNSAFNIIATTQKFYKEVHNQDVNVLLGDSPNQKLPLVSVVHYGGKGGTKDGYDNAFWDPENGVMVYGDGRFFVPLVTEHTVGTHEASHMVTEELGGTAYSQPTGLDYVGDAGGLNEFNSDAGAIACLQKEKKQHPNDSDCSWRIGQGLFRKYPQFALRDMEKPGQGYKNHPKLGSDPQEGYEDYRNWFEYSKDVDPHLSSATGNSAYCRIAKEAAAAGFGDTWETIEKVRILTLPLCKPTITYPEYAQLQIKVAKEWKFETDKFWQIVANGWKEVGVLQ
jgi:Zn-dependent metalloprotease